MKKIGQHFLICLWLEPRVLTPPPPYGQPDRRISVFYDFPYMYKICSQCLFHDDFGVSLGVLLTMNLFLPILANYVNFVVDFGLLF